MSQSTIASATTNNQRLAEDLLACAEEQVAAWLHFNRAALSLELIQYLKDHYATAEQIQVNPQRAERATSYGLQAAQAVPENAAMLALAQWARGIWANFNDLASAAALYQSALEFYRTTDDRLSQARLLSNLVGVLADCGDNPGAEAAYAEASLLLADYPDVDPRFLMRLEQNFGWLLHSWGRYHEALAVHERALRLAQQASLPLIAAEIRVNRHLTLGRLGYFAECEQGFRQDRLLAMQHHQQLTVARIDMNLGELYTILGRPADALRAFQQSEQGFAQSQNPMEQSVVLALQATLLRQLGAWRVAQRHYQSALSLLEQHQLQSIQGETFVNQAICLRLLGGKKQLQRAVELLKRAEIFWSKNNNPYWIGRVYFEQILTAQAQNQLARAEELLNAPPILPLNPNLQAEFRLLKADSLAKQATTATQAQQVITDYEAVIEFATTQGIHWLRRQALRGLGRFYLPHQWSKGRQLLEAAATTDDRLRQSLSLQELKASFHEQANDLFDDLIRSAYQQADHQLVLHYAWRAKASAFLDLAASARGEATATAEQQAAIEQVRKEMATLRWKLATTAERNLVNERYEASSPELASLEEQLLNLRRQTQQEQPSSASLEVEQLPAILQQMGEAVLLEYVRCGEELYGICATADGVQAAILLTNMATVADLAGQLALAFHSFNALGPTEREQVLSGRLIESQSLLGRCYELLISPFQPYLAGRQAARHILVAPCDALAMLPFAAFWTGKCYWIEEQELDFIQSGALLALAPILAPTYSRPLVVAASSGQATAVRQEAAQLANRLIDSAIFIDAPVLAYWAGLQAPPRLVHIAAHTLQRGDAPLFTGIQLSGEVLSVEQSYELPLWGTELVILSGCSTAGGMESEASLFAFQSALLIAGAQRVLCTLWPIADGMASPLLHDFYTLLSQGMKAPAALRQTQYKLIHQNSSYSHPALWAAFTCIRR